MHYINTTHSNKFDLWCLNLSKWWWIKMSPNFKQWPEVLNVIPWFSENSVHAISLKKRWFQKSFFYCIRRYNIWDKLNRANSYKEIDVVLEYLIYTYDWCKLGFWHYAPVWVMSLALDWRKACPPIGFTKAIGVSGVLVVRTGSLLYFEGASFETDGSEVVLVDVCTLFERLFILLKSIIWKDFFL